MSNTPAEVTIDDKKYVIISKESYERLTKDQVYQKYSGDFLTLEEAKARTLERIGKWAKSK